MRSKEDHAGKSYWRLTAIALAWLRGRHPVWLFRCECGNFKFAATGNVKRGRVKSCGCLHRDVARELARETHRKLDGKGPGAFGFKHGRCDTPEYRSWGSMLTRCTNPKAPDYRHYGGRGITVCDQWSPKRGGSFENFYADMGSRPPGTSLDRYPDNNGNYQPGNCRWATPKQQRANRRDVDALARMKEKSITCLC